jgi:outer membrane protein OmpA-like peptidoglycan-associated protein
MRRDTGSLAVAALLAAALLGIGGVRDAAAAGEAAPSSTRPPRVVPFPAPPAGPRIRRVTHDALHPVTPGVKVIVRVLTEPGATVKASIGSTVRDIPCSPVKGEEGAYVCAAAVIPYLAVGTNRVRAEATDSKGRVSSLGAALPVVVEAAQPWRGVNALNVRLRPAYFAAGAADLDGDARDALAADAEILKAHPDLPIAIEGHSDPREGGNLADLSRRRAEAVCDHLAGLGVAKERMKTAALADSQPFSNPRSGADPGVNRIVMILFEPPAPS